MQHALHLGTCSWKFKDWRGIIYADTAPEAYLAEYARHFGCVEIDQWFWSLFAPGKVALPKPGDVSRYATDTPPDFRFGVKLPNAVTLTHYRAANASTTPDPNPHFLSEELTRAFLDTLTPLHDRLGPLMLQFEYLNRGKMPSQADFQARLQSYAGHLPRAFTWAVECRNPNYLNARFFTFLRDQELAPVLEQGYYLPPVRSVYEKIADHIGPSVVIRLHGPDRQAIERRAGATWNRIVDPRDTELDDLAAVIRDLAKRKREVWLFANNHFEGCAPLTLDRLRQRLADSYQGST